jgi:hypothetical protein
MGPRHETRQRIACSAALDRISPAQLLTADPLESAPSPHNENRGVQWVDYRTRVDETSQPFEKLLKVYERNGPNAHVAIFRLSVAQSA